MALKRDKLDKVVSDLVRYRDQWTCQRCRKSFIPPHAGFHCSHFKSRAHKGTRWDLLNCDGLCWNCHKHFAANITEYRQWKVSRIGEESVTLLEYKARNVFKLNQAEKDFLYQGLAKELKVRIQDYRDRSAALETHWR